MEYNYITVSARTGQFRLVEIDLCTNVFCGTLTHFANRPLPRGAEGAGQIKGTNDTARAWRLMSGLFPVRLHDAPREMEDLMMQGQIIQYHHS